MASNSNQKKRLEGWQNSGTCGSSKGLKLFGVRIVSGGGDEDVMRKSASMVDLTSCNSSERSAHGDRGYVSEDLARSSADEKRQKRKGVPWSEQEHRTFLEGLERLGKGDWKGISRNFVKTRTPTQVASHAQKYFLRKASKNKKRRSSLFDMAINDIAPTAEARPSFPSKGANNAPGKINLRNHDTYLRGFVVRNQESVGSSRFPPTFSRAAASGFSRASRFTSLPNAMLLNFLDGSALASSFVQISLNSPPQVKPNPYCPPQETALPPLMENCNLELTIAPSSAA